MTSFQVDLDSFASAGTLYTSATPVDRDGQSSPLHRISQCDLITFIAIAQSVDVNFIDINWHHGLGSAGKGASADIYQSLAKASTSLAFKKLVHSHDESYMYKTALSEILILQHPLIRAEENIIDLYGVGWDIKKTEDTGVNQLVPVLVHENASRYGDLDSFIKNIRPTINDIIREPPRLDNRDLDYWQRLQLCKGIGQAVKSMHSCKIKAAAEYYTDVIHGDLKPKNILIFPSQEGGGYIPKIIDFGYSTYGFKDSDLVKLPSTKEWRAPEWHHRAFRMQDAKKNDIYSFAKICEWLLEGDIGYYLPSINKEAVPHMSQFYQYGLCEDPPESAQGGSFFQDVLRLNPSGVEKSFRDTYGQERCMKIMSSIIAGVQEHSSNVKKLFEESNLEPNDTLSLLRKDLPQIIDISKDFLHFQNIHFLVRVRIQERLLELSTDERQPPGCLNQIAFQLALCYELAFGVSRDISKSLKWLRMSGKHATRLSAVLDKLRSSSSYHKEVRALVKVFGEFGSDYSFLEDGLLDNAVEILRIESEGKLASLGPYAPATLLLQRHFALSLKIQGRLHEAMDLLRHMVDSSKNKWGPHALWPFLLQLEISAILAQQGDLLGAISICERLLQMELWESRKKEFGETHPAALSALELLSYAMTDVNMEEAERMQTEVLEYRRKVLGENNHITIQTMKSLALVKMSIKGKETKAIELQRDVLFRLTESTDFHWTKIVGSYNQMIWQQGRENQFDEAIKTGDQILGRKEELLACPQGLALLGNHAGNLKAVGRNTEAESLSVEILQEIPIILKPIPRISSVIIRGVARAFLNDGMFDNEATVLYVKARELWQKRLKELGKLHDRAAVADRFRGLLYNEGYILQSTIHILGLEHTTTKLAIVGMETRLSNFVKGDIEIEGYISEVIVWIKTRIASFKTNET